jgi:hypothetical protein
VSIISFDVCLFNTEAFYSRNAGVITEMKGKQNLVGEAMDRARAELEGRTGETDSEIESDEEVSEPEAEEG